MAVGTAGWVGGSLDLVAMDPSGARTVRARVWLQAGCAQTDLDTLQSQWERQGIVGRGDRGRLYPRDGQAFLDELPFVYRTPYLMAVPSRLQVSR